MTVAAHVAAISTLVIAVVGCHSQTADPDVYRTDSIVLERGPCTFGGCPVYRLRVAKSGALLFTSPHLVSSTDTVSNGKLLGLLQDLELAAFFYLPDRIEDNKHFCPGIAADFSTVTVSVYWPGGLKRVEDYQGCIWAPVALRRLEDAIDSAAGAGQRAPSTREARGARR